MRFFIFFQLYHMSQKNQNEKSPILNGQIKYKTSGKVHKMRDLEGPTSIHPFENTRQIGEVGGLHHPVDEGQGGAGREGGRHRGGQQAHGHQKLQQQQPLLCFIFSFFFVQVLNTLVLCLMLHIFIQFIRTYSDSEGILEHVVSLIADVSSGESDHISTINCVHNQLDKITIFTIYCL